MSNKTFASYCTGGTPCCVKFGTSCPRSLTLAVATRLGSGLVKVLAPEAMPCYSTDPLEFEKPRRNTKPKARVSDYTEKQWHAWFKAETPVRQLEEITKISTTTLRKKRNELGYPPVLAGGAIFQKYFEKDALKIAKIRKPGETLKSAAERAGYSYESAKVIATRFRDIIRPSASGRSRR